MNTIFRTYQFELQPTQEQKVLLDKHFGCIRFVYNHFLNERKEHYQADKKSNNYYAQAATLTELKKKDETIWLKEVNSQSLQFALRCLDTSYVNFFRGNAKFPRFKSRKKKNTFTVPQFAKLEDGNFTHQSSKKELKLTFTVK
jgi:putative transposase